MQEDNGTAPVWEHISELRRTFIQIVLCVLIGFSLCFLFYQHIFSFLTDPLQQTAAEGSLHKQELKRERLLNVDSKDILYTPSPSALSLQLSAGSRQLEGGAFLIPPGGYIDFDRVTKNEGLIVLGPLEGMATAFKVCFWLGLLLSSPAWGFLLLRFIAPALKEEERQLVLPFISLSSLFILLGFSLAYWITIPLANLYLKAFNSSIGVNLWTLANYLDYTFFLLVANGIACELGLILFFLVHLGVLTADTMIAKRRHMVVIAFILGALLTPPEILTQFMLALPILVLYELTILYAKYKKRSLVRDSDMH